jgi:hypothetical protein
MPAREASPPSFPAKDDLTIVPRLRGWPLNGGGAGGLSISDTITAQELAAARAALRVT